MAAKIFYRKGFLLLLFIFISNAALDKRFSDLKRCADEECSMLLVRGKAIQDFSGPDCRFLSFKKSETIYVYYKLSGRRADMWAGSVGSRFGYFPKDLLAVNHIYTEKEIEVSAEETDFVCFDTGYDKFDDYDVDSLLGSTTSMEDNEDGDTSDPIEMAADTEEQTQPAVDESAEDADQTDDRDDSLDLERVPEEQSASMLQPVDTTKSLATEDVEHKAGDEVDGAETDADDTGRQQRNKGDSILESVDLDRREAKGASASPEVKPAPRVDRESEKVSSSVGKQIPELKTTFGTTFDAVTTDDEVTWKVTPYEEGESEELNGRGYADGDQDAHDDNQQDTPKGNPLLLTAAKPEDTPETDTPETDTPETDLPDELERPQQTHGEDEDEDTDNDDPHTSEDGGMWTSLGDKVFAIVSGGEKMARGSSSEEDEDEDEGVTEEETAADEPLRTREGTEDIEPPPAEPTEETQAKDLDDDGSPLPLVSEDGDKQTDEDDTPSLLDDEEDENPRKVVGHEPDQDKSSTRPADEQGSEEKPPEVTRAEAPASRGTRPVDSLHHKLDIKTRDEPIERETVGDDSEVQDDDALLRDDSTSNHSADTEENKTGHEERSVMGTESEEHEKSNNSESTDKPEKDDADGNLFRQYLEHSLKQFKKNNSQKKMEVDVGLRVEEELPPEDTEGEEKEVLLEDENAISSSGSHARHTEGDKPSLAAHPPTPEPDYSDSILRLTLLREHFKEEDMGRLRRFLSLTNLFKVEAMLSDLDLELQAARLSDTATTEDIEKALDSIMEASENYILDEIEKMLDGRDTKNTATPETDESVFDEEAQLLDEFQEIAFRLRQKYSAASDSTPLTPESDQVSIDEHALNVEGGEKGKPLHTVEEEQNNVVTEEKDAALGDADAGEAEQGEADEAHKRPDINVEKDGGHFNANKDNHPSYSVVEEMQKGPQAILDNPFDMGLIVEMDPSGSLDSVDPVSDFQEEEWSFFSSGLFYTSCIFAMIKTKICDWIVVMISLLPEEWKPGESPFGCPWQAVAGTAFVGIMTVTMFFWKSVLAVKKREYLVDEKGLNHQIKALKKEKSDAILRMSELQQQTEELKEKQKQSEETTTCALKRNQDLESKVLEAERQNKQVAGERQSYAARLKEEREKSQRNDTRIEKLEKSNEKLQQSRKKTQEALAKTTVLLDEAKLREEARNIQHKCLERDYAALKEQNKTLKVTIIGWEDKHKDLSEQIKVYQKSQKELEDSVVLKDHNVEVLSDLLADLDACDMQRNDGKVLANGEVPIDKKTAIKNRIKQMMDVSRVQTTLSVVEDERDRFMTKLLNEEKARKALEENHQDLEHTIAALKSDKSHVENQFKILQQKNEIMTEMYQQKENALQQRLTKEELERRSKESLLSEVGGKAVEAEEQVKVLRQRINEMEEQMKKTEEVYKEQIKEQENKTHSNWVNARNAERALNQEKVETSKLREKLAVLTSQLNERRAPLFRPNSGQLVGPRQGDSYGPSPVSGGAPSPPPMIEGPRRPPSAPVGRRIDPYGPRPPSDPHGRYLDNKHTSDINAPRTSSPSLDDSGPGSFSSSCIVDSPGSRGQGSPLGPPAGMGHSHPPPPPGPHSRLQHPGPHRLPRPGPGPHGHLYHPAAGLPGPLPPHGAPLPANGHPGLLQPSLIGAEFGPRPSNGHALRPRLGPGHTTDPRGQPPLHFRPPPPHHFGPMPPPHGMRGPMGPRPPFPPDMRFPGPWDHPHPAGPLFPGGVPPHRDAFVQGPPERPNLPGGPHPGPGQDQDLSMKPEAAPQDSVRSAMAEP